jgi:hypothetical protein
VISSGRNMDGKIMASTERHEHYHHHHSHQYHHHHDDGRSAHLSDGELAHYDEDHYESLQRRRGVNLSRESV